MHRLGQEDQNNFLTDQMSRFWLTSLELGPRGALKSAIWRRLSIDFCRIRAPMRGHRKMVCFPHFSPHDRSKKGNAIGKTKHALHSRKAITFGMFDGSLVHRKWQGALRSHFHGVGGHRRRRCPWRFWRIPGAQNQGCTPKPYDVVGDILDTLFLTTLTSAVYANSSSQQL